MSKNKYILPFSGKWYIEYGGNTKETSHSFDVISQRYAYDFEVRENDLPYHDDYHKCENYYSYLKDIICPCDGYVVEVVDKYDNTKILDGRPVICDVDSPYGNHIIIKHKHNEYSVICHIEKGSFNVKIGDIVEEGEILAKVGNSGNTQGPHIHYHLQSGINLETSKGIKIKFKDVYYVNKKIKKTKYIEKDNYVTNKKSK